MKDILKLGCEIKKIDSYQELYRNIYLNFISFSFYDFQMYQVRLKKPLLSSEMSPFLDALLRQAFKDDRY